MILSADDACQQLNVYERLPRRMPLPLLGAMVFGSCDCWASALYYSEEEEEEKPSWLAKACKILLLLLLLSALSGTTRSRHLDVNVVMMQQTSPCKC